MAIETYRIPQTYKCGATGFLRLINVEPALMRQLNTA